MFGFLSIVNKEIKYLRGQKHKNYNHVIVYSSTEKKYVTLYMTEKDLERLTNRGEQKKVSRLSKIFVRVMTFFLKPTIKTS